MRRTGTWMLQAMPLTHARHAPHRLGEGARGKPGAGRGAGLLGWPVARAALGAAGGFSRPPLSGGFSRSISGRPSAAFRF